MYTELRSDGLYFVEGIKEWHRNEMEMLIPDFYDIWHFTKYTLCHHVWAEKYINYYFNGADFEELDALHHYYNKREENV